MFEATTGEMALFVGIVAVGLLFAFAPVLVRARLGGRL